MISDEIYAQCVYRTEKCLSGEGEATESKENETGGFVSASVVCKEKGIPTGQDIHVLYGFSKDFCMGGMRVATLYTENNTVRVSTFCDCATC